MQTRAEKPRQVGQALPGGKQPPPAPTPRWPRSTSPAPSQEHPTSARPSRSCRCIQAGSRGGVALGGQTPRSPSCFAERCRGGTYIPASRSSSAGGPAAGKGEEKELGLPIQRSSNVSRALIHTQLGPGHALAPWAPPAWECYPAPSAPGPGLGLTTWTMSREKIWMQQTTAESVQTMVERTVKPQTLKRRSWGGAG